MFTAETGSTEAPRGTLPCSRNGPFYCSFRDGTSETRESSRESYLSDNLYRPPSLFSVGRLARMYTASFTPLAKKSGSEFRISNKTECSRDSMNDAMLVAPCILLEF
ncbi:hypothetical protein Bbelb_158180 [Branchiostoma belcheri]|nr:hypothetical protein Bbelb_158180 [Branchiostoma belcheri]